MKVIERDGKLFVQYPSSDRQYRGVKVVCECGEFKVVRDIRAPESWLCDLCREAKFYTTLSCQTCGKSFRRQKGNLSNSKSGLYFCCRECKDAAQTIRGGLKAIWPAHYGDGSSEYRSAAFKAFPNECVDCGFDFYPLLEVHHIDGERSNGALTNLEIVCPTHHRLRHLRQIKDQWEFATSYLTDRRRLNELRKKVGGIV